MSHIFASLYLLPSYVLHLFLISIFLQRAWGWFTDFTEIHAFTGSDIWWIQGLSAWPRWGAAHCRCSFLCLPFNCFSFNTNTWKYTLKYLILIVFIERLLPEVPKQKGTTEAWSASVHMSMKRCDEQQDCPPVVSLKLAKPQRKVYISKSYSVANIDSINWSIWL